MRGIGSQKRRGAQQAGTARYGIIISAAGHKPVTKKSRAAARDAKKSALKEKIGTNLIQEQKNGWLFIISVKLLTKKSAVCRPFDFAPACPCGGACFL
ncbi:MAG: hypothetical protein MR743_07580 [Oscillospiraceae bacterium]|nr:hypothetical protein [Oscillospiraceae bacterium]